MEEAYTSEIAPILAMLAAPENIIFERLFFFEGVTFNNALYCLTEDKLR